MSCRSSSTDVLWKPAQAVGPSVHVTATTRNTVAASEVLQSHLQKVPTFLRVTLETVLSLLGSIFWGGRAGGALADGHASPAPHGTTPNDPNVSQTCVHGTVVGAKQTMALIQLHTASMDIAVLDDCQSRYLPVDLCNV